MRVSIYLSAVSCLLLSLTQRVVLQEDGASVACQPLTKASLNIVCKTNGVKQPCQDAGVNTTASMRWKKTIIRNYTSNEELVCQAGEWKKTMKLFVPPGYVEVPGIGAYKIHKAGLNWHEAGLRCLSEGAHIMVIDSFEELAALKYIGVNELQQEEAKLHIGVHDIFTEGATESILGKPYTFGTILKFKNGEPNGQNKENCFCMWNLEVYDGDCSKVRSFVCEALRTPYDVTLKP